MKKLLIANRGEIAIRIGQTAKELGYSTIAVFPEDDASSLHVQQSDESVQIPGAGAQAYLNIEEIINAAKTCAADDSTLFCRALRRNFPTKRSA